MPTFAEQGYGERTVLADKPQHALSAPALQTQMAGFNLNRDCVLPPDSEHRQFRLKLADKSFVKVRQRINSSEDLKRWLNFFNPTDVYVSVSTWLNPEAVSARNITKTGRSPKAGWKQADLVLLGSNYFADFDAKDYVNGLQGAFRVMLGMWELLKQKDFKDFVFVRTGKGFQLWTFGVYQSLPKKIPRVKDRLDYVERAKKKLTTELAAKLEVQYAAELKRKEFAADYPQSRNTLQIGRVWGSVHNNGTVVEWAKNPFTKKLLFPEVVK
ncbi:MAG: hypothetical protein HY376_03255 [Candidatus Blackburnbacteria bacterium]|nr:hypothetical protein [Candidatus Blackburnbacteria bacterium]